MVVDGKIHYLFVINLFHFIRAGVYLNKVIIARTDVFTACCHIDVAVIVRPDPPRIVTYLYFLYFFERFCADYGHGVVHANSVPIQPSGIGYIEFISLHANSVRIPSYCGILFDFQ